MLREFGQAPAADPEGYPFRQKTGKLLQVVAFPEKYLVIGKHCLDVFLGHLLGMETDQPERAISTHFQSMPGQPKVFFRLRDPLDGQFKPGLRTLPHRGSYRNG